MPLRSLCGGRAPLVDQECVTPGEAAGLSRAQWNRADAERHRTRAQMTRMLLVLAMILSSSARADDLPHRDGMDPVRYVLVFALLGCAASARSSGEARFGPNGHAPSDYVSDQPAACPARPSVGDACRVANDVSCRYLAPERGPCEFDACTCTAVASAPRTEWRCEHAIE
jgi:hypothetical protein